MGASISSEAAQTLSETANTNTPKMADAIKDSAQILGAAGKEAAKTLAESRINQSGYGIFHKTLLDSIFQTGTWFA